MLELCRDEDTSAKLNLFEPCQDEPKVMSTVEKKIIQRISSLDVAKSINLVNLPHCCACGADAVLGAPAFQAEIHESI